MARHHQHLSPYQMGIVRRFFAHRDTVLRQRLAELVTELYLSEPGKGRDRMWKSVGDTMGRAGVDPADIDAVCGGRDLEALARIVSELNRPASRTPTNRPPAGDDSLE
jgi:hypothetical protein